MQRTNKPAPSPKTVTLSIELTPFELAVIHFVCGSVDGSGKARDVISDGETNLYQIIQELATENGIDLWAERKKIRKDMTNAPKGSIYLRDAVE